MSEPVSFGTDGIRGRAYDEITVDLAFRLGSAVGTVFGAPVFVGYDTRESSPVLAAAALAGLSAVGASGTNLGVITTPGVAIIAQQRQGVGIVVSASHNPYYDNGLKVLGLGGTKLDLATEAAVAAALAQAPVAPASTFDEVPVDTQAVRDYVRHLQRAVPTNFAPLHIVLDCANGASSHLAADLFRAAGAEVTVLHHTPDGHNINKECGSTHPDSLVAEVLRLGADLGLAFDGDADRLIAVDATGTIRDGDDLMVLFALDSAEVRDTGVVVTSMSNLGLRRALNAAAVTIVETDVGDRNVLIALEEKNWKFGGEQSGHLIFRDVSPTGDGLLTGLHVADLVVRRGPLAALADEAWRRVPQALVNVARDVYDEQYVQSTFRELSETYAVAEADVRLLIRRSGTEPLVRVMVEAIDPHFVDAFATRVRSHFAV
jgi:phosphoglucosamine mutase